MRRLLHAARALFSGPRKPELPKPDQPDWAAIGVVEVRVSGTGQRYEAHFTDADVAYPVPGLMTRDERRVANAMLLLGLPPARVSTLGADDPPPISPVGEPHIIEIPRETAP